VKLTINNQTTEVPCDYQDELLLWLLRDGMGLTGTHYGCGVGKCGSCMVLVNRAPTRSCQTPVANVIGTKIATIEGLCPNGSSETLHPVQQAFTEYPLQCMWCLPGHMITTVALLEENADPNGDDIAEAMKENLCRCGGYN
jgi:aerobic-type carbon monoxide dehydrogenase small subunit (CoxS/CutS family)